MPYDNIIVDFDGTITDSKRDIARAQLWVLERLGARGHREEDLYPFIGLPLGETFRELLPASMHGMIDEASELYAAYYPSRSLLTTRLFPGVRRTLGKLRARGKKIAVASTKRGPGIRRATDHFGITPFFDRLQGSEGLPFKPDPAIIHLIMAEEGWSPGVTIMVGDTAMDVMAGRNAGIATCGVTYGAMSEEQILTVAPDYIIGEFSSLLSLVG
ncbi:MAG TPA: HAD-IA family hydrolase [Bacteroidota bacterium]|nr:HAD-IA family hydrolase [Bacteroidota bacterium]